MTDLPARSSSLFAFGPFEIMPERKLLLKNGAPVKVGCRAYAVLLALVERHGEVVSKNELLALGWPEVAVDERNLKVHIAALRTILRDTRAPSRYIATVTGRGYRFVAGVECISDPRRTSRDGHLERANNLPATRKRIFGRTETIEYLRNELCDSRLISIVGPGGIGKTTVALQVADLAMNDFDDGAWLVDFSAINQESQVRETIATAIGFSAEYAKTAASVYECLRNRKMLLIFDNCEHLLDEIACWVDRILQCAKHVKVLATTREPLCIKGERVRRLQGLGMPPPTHPVNASEALTYPAVQLFVDRATEALPSFVLHDAIAPIVVEICRRLDGLALAIERVALRVETHDVKRMLDHLDNRFYMYDGFHAGPDRHRTLTAAISSSYSLLSQTERVVICRLSLVVGAFDLETALVIGASEFERIIAVECVASLVAKSLLLAESGSMGMTYRQANLLRAFALQKLIESGDYENTRQRHTLRYLHLAQQASAKVDHLSGPEWAATQELLVDDILEALTWRFKARQDDALSTDLIVAAIPFLSSRSANAVSVLAAEKALQIAKARGDKELCSKCIALLLSGPTSVTQVDDNVRKHAWSLRGPQ